MSPKRKILAISGSTKKVSTSHTLLKYLAQHYSNDLEWNIYTDIGKLPHFNPELEAELPETVQALRMAIAEADGVLFCTPEYVYSLPGSLKNAIEWNVSTVLFSNKPVGIIVAAATGEKAFASLDLIMRTIEAYIPQSAKVLIQGAKGKLNAAGQVTDEEVGKQLEALVRALVAAMEDEGREPNKYTEDYP